MTWWTMRKEGDMVDYEEGAREVFDMVDHERGVRRRVTW